MNTKELTDKQRAFCEYYLRTWNATESARLAGYKGSYSVVKSIGCENLTKPYLRKYIENRLNDLTLKADEVLLRLSQQASASISDFIEFTKEGFNLDQEKIKQYGHIIKKIEHTKYGVRIELHDSQSALVHIGRYYKLFTDKLEIDDWRNELESQSISASEEFEKLVEELISKIDEQPQAE